MIELYLKFIFAFYFCILMLFMIDRKVWERERGTCSRGTLAGIEQVSLRSGLSLYQVSLYFLNLNPDQQSRHFIDETYSPGVLRVAEILSPPMMSTTLSCSRSLRRCSVALRGSGSWLSSARFCLMSFEEASHSRPYSSVDTLSGLLPPGDHEEPLKGGYSLILLCFRLLTYVYMLYVC